MSREEFPTRCSSMRRSFHLPKQLFCILLLLAVGAATVPASSVESTDDPIVLEAPAEGTVFHTGDTLWVKWQTVLEDIINVTIELSLDNGK